MVTKAVLADFLVNAGPHPMWGDEGWQIAFDFGMVQVSIADCPTTEGVELMVHGIGMQRPLTYVTPALAVMVLDRILDSLAERSKA